MKNNQPPEMMSQEVFCEIYAVPKTRYFQEVKNGFLIQTPLGKRRYISRVDAEKWLEGLKLRQPLKRPPGA